LTLKRVGEHREMVEPVVRECLDAMETSGPPVDFVDAFAYPVPLLVLCELLAVPRNEQHRFERPLGVLSDRWGPTSRDQKKQGMVEFYAYVRELIERKRLHPSSDLLSELASTGELSDDELAGVAFFLFAGGHHTTATMLELSVFFLLAERDRWETARTNLDSIDRTVEELLRYLNPINIPHTRTAIEDVAIAGVMIKAGETIAVHTPQPSGDPERIPDRQQFDPSRDPATGHLAFGHGRHMCLGQHLARLELQLALAALMRRLPTLHLAEPAGEVPLRRLGVPERADEHDVHGIDHLLVAW
jgi:cytochrome P450